MNRIFYFIAIIAPIVGGCDGSPVGAEQKLLPVCNEYIVSAVGQDSDMHNTQATCYSKYAHLVIIGNSVVCRCSDAPRDVK